MPDGITAALLCRFHPSTHPFDNEGSGRHLRSVSVVVLPTPKVAPSLVECDDDDDDDDDDEEVCV